MGLNRQEKAAKIEEVGALVAAAQTIVVAEYRGLDVESATKLRKQARSHWNRCSIAQGDTPILASQLRERTAP